MIKYTTDTLTTQPYDGHAKVLLQQPHISIYHHNKMRPLHLMHMLSTVIIL